MISRQLSRRTLTRAALLGAAPGALLVGCATAVGPAPSVAPGPDAAALVLALVEAWASEDKAAFVAALSPNEARRAEVMWDTWRALALVEVSRDAADATGSSVTVRWRASGEKCEASDTFRVVADAGGPRLIPGTPWPLWWTHRLVVVTEGGATLLSAPELTSTHRQEWLGAAASAIERLRRSDLSPWQAGWDGTLVVVIPADAYEFSRVTELRTQVAQTGAATWQPRDRAPRVIVNPDALGIVGAADRVSLLVHEGVHAVSGSSWRVPASVGSALTLAEGFAESVACAEDPARAARNAALIRAAGPNTPSSAVPDAAAYALAQMTYERAVARWGRPAVHSWLNDWTASNHPSDAEIADA